MDLRFSFARETRLIDLMHTEYSVYCHVLDGSGFYVPTDTM